MTENLKERSDLNMIKFYYPELVNLLYTQKNTRDIPKSFFRKDIVVYDRVQRRFSPTPRGERLIKMVEEVKNRDE